MRDNNTAETLENFRGQMDGLRMALSLFVVSSTSNEQRSQFASLLSNVAEVFGSDGVGGSRQYSDGVKTCVAKLAEQLQPSRSVPSASSAGE